MQERRASIHLGPTWLPCRRGEPVTPGASMAAIIQEIWQVVEESRGKKCTAPTAAPMASCGEGWRGHKNTLGVVSAIEALRH